MGREGSAYTMGQRAEQRDCDADMPGPGAYYRSAEFAAEGPAFTMQGRPEGMLTYRYSTHAAMAVAAHWPLLSTMRSSPVHHRARESPFFQGLLPCIYGDSRSLLAFFVAFTRITSSAYLYAGWDGNEMM
eukprot:scaffold66406_cov35-Prasinocladus_malaysianus.AAC.1